MIGSVFVSGNREGGVFDWKKQCGDMIEMLVPFKSVSVFCIDLILYYLFIFSFY